MLTANPETKEQFLAALADVEMQEELAKLGRETGQSVEDVALSIPGVSGIKTLHVDVERHQRHLLIWRRLQQLAREWTSPHVPPTSAGNFELMAMNVGRLVRACDVLIERYALPCDWAELLYAASETDPTIRQVFATTDGWWELLKDTQYSLELQHRLVNQTGDFLGSWVLGGFPRLEISHKYAAALCCTDCPSTLDIRAPWKAWSLVVPPGLTGDHTPARLWAVGSTWIGVLWPNGLFVAVPPRPSEYGREDDFSAWHLMMLNLIRGCCLSLAEPDQHRKHGGRSHGKNNKRSGPPDLSQARFMLAPAVTVDLRQHVLDALSGKHGGGAPTVQFLVRGHFRQQAHGAGRALRKTIWIEPFWKGPEAGNILLRTHKIKDDG